MRKLHVTLGVLGLLAAVVVSPAIMLMGAFWLSTRTHEFGPYDMRYLLLVKGTTVHRLGLLAPLRGSVTYFARGQDGNSPAYVRVTFKTIEQQARIIDAYRESCQRLGLEAAIEVSPAGVPGLSCLGPAGDEIGVTAERQGAMTDVSVGGWVF